MDELLCAAIGLARTMDAAPDPRGISVLCEALHNPASDAPARLREEKFRISPGCRTCSSPCGRHADYEEAQAAQDAPELQAAKHDAWQALLRYARSRPAVQCRGEAVVRLVFYLGESWVDRDDLARCLAQLQ